MPNTLLLPQTDGTLGRYCVRSPGATREWHKPIKPLRSRIAYSAAHVVCDPLGSADPTTASAIDWDATLAYRHHLWSYGLGVAEAMDTAQRGTGLNWEMAKELIRRSIKEAQSVNGLIACGAGTDHLAPDESVTLERVEAAYAEQVGFVEAHGGRVILMASRALARCAKTPDDYVRIYGNILRQVERPVILHWLGEMFDPQLRGYWGTSNTEEGMDVCLSVIRDNQTKVDGIKISLLDANKEVEMRRRLPVGVKMYTGDDFNYDVLIKGDEHGYSHALLGIFDAIAPAASVALQALDKGDVEEYDRTFAPTVPLSRHIFAPPTQHYKTGVVFLAYLNNHQTHFRMIGAAESLRNILHLSELFRLADATNLLVNPDIACERMRRVLAVAGVV